MIPWRLKKYLITKKHSIESKWSKTLGERIIDLLGVAAWVTLVFYEREIDWFVISCGTFMVYARIYPIYSKWKENKVLVDFRKKRRIQTATCLEKLNVFIESPETTNSNEIQDIRRKLLDCIADSVREYRNDMTGVKIYSNLLIPDGDTIKVIARNAPSRIPGTVYAKSDLKCCEVLETLEPTYCGDVQQLTNRKLEYKSFMALPIINYYQNVCIAILTIDSTELHHFDEIYESFDTLLRPYIATIATTFVIERNGSST